MLPFTQFRNLEYVRHFLHALDNYIYGASTIVCNYYHLDPSATKTFDGQVQTAPSQPFHNLQFQLYLLQPIFNVQSNALHITSENNSVPQFTSSQVEAFLFIDPEQFEPTLGDRVCFSTKIENLLSRQSTVFFKVVGLEVIQRDYRPIYKLTLEKDKTLLREQDLLVSQVFGFTPIVNQYREFNKFLLDLKSIDVLKNYQACDFCNDIQGNLANSYQIFYCAKFKLGLVNRPELASLIKTTVTNQLAYFVTDCNTIQEFRIYKVDDVKYTLSIPRLPSYTHIVLAKQANTNAQNANVSWNRLRLEQTSFRLPWNKLDQMPYRTFNLDHELETLQNTSQQDLLHQLQNMTQCTIRTNLKALVLALKVLRDGN